MLVHLLGQVLSIVMAVRGKMLGGVHLLHIVITYVWILMAVVVVVQEEQCF